MRSCYRISRYGIFASLAARTCLWAMTLTWHASLQALFEVNRQNKQAFLVEILPLIGPLAVNEMSCHSSDDKPTLYARWKCIEERQTQLAPIIKVVIFGIHQWGKVKYIQTDGVQDFRNSIKANELQEKHFTEHGESHADVFHLCHVIDMFSLWMQLITHAHPVCLSAGLSAVQELHAGKSARAGWALDTQRFQGDAKKLVFWFICFHCSGKTYLKWGSPPSKL